MKHICTCSGRRANAQLIASAPELLEAVEQAIVELEYCRDNHKNDIHDKRIINSELKFMKQAISRAEGEG